MPKFERVLKLAWLTRDRQVGTVREMSQACGVSQRTIYRYLNTLAHVEADGRLGRGYGPPRGADQTHRLEPEDRCLICYALGHNPLARSAFFWPKLVRLRKRFQQATGETNGRSRGRWLEIATNQTRPRPSRQDHLLTSFIEVWRSEKTMAVRTRCRPKATMNLWPESVRLSAAGVQLQFVSPETGKHSRFDLNDIVSLGLRRERSAVQTARGGVRKKG